MHCVPKGALPFYISGLQYNPEEANTILDGLGMDQRDGDGFRLAPNGETFIMPIEIGQQAADLAPVTELIVEFWNDIGIRTTMRIIDNNLLGTRNAANELQATVEWVHQPMWAAGAWPDFTLGSTWRLWQLWYNSRGEQGEEPPTNVQRLYELSELIMASEPGTSEDEKLFEEIFDIYYNDVNQILIVENALKPVIISSKMGNVPTGGRGVGTNNSGEQMFFRSE